MNAQQVLPSKHSGSILIRQAGQSIPDDLLKHLLEKNTTYVSASAANGSYIARVVSKGVSAEALRTYESGKMKDNSKPPQQ